MADFILAHNILKW